jgi:thiol-disulfide isomerase/thioredoxin
MSRKTHILVAIVLSCMLSLPAAALESISITPNELVEKVNVNNGNLKVVFIFTSWCGVCQKVFPSVMSLKERYKDKKFELIVVSLDEDDNKLKRYLDGFSDVSKVYKLVYIKRDQVAEGFAKAGILFSGSIPHFTIYHFDNKVIDSGNFSMDSLVKNLDILLN